MKLKLTEIPEGGLTIQEELPVGWLVEQSGFGPDDPYRPTGPVVLNLNVRKAKRQVTVSGTATATLAFVCSHCAEDGLLTPTATLRETFLPADKFRLPEGRALDLEEQDFQNAFYDNDEIELGRYVAESIVLALPMFPVCERPECADVPGDHREDWDEPEAHKRVNPMWKAGLAQVKDKLKLKK